MKNYILIFSFLVIFPISGNESDNITCNSKKSNTSEYNCKDKEKMQPAGNPAHHLQESTEFKSIRIFYFPA